MDRTKLQECIALEAKMRDVRIALADINYLQIGMVEECDIRIATKTGAVKVDGVKVTDAIKYLVHSLNYKLTSEYAELNAKMEAM